MDSEVNNNEIMKVAGSGVSRLDLMRQYAVATVVNLLMLSYGLAAGWAAVVLPRLMDPSDSPLPSGALSLEHSTWLATLFAITGIPVAPLVAVVAERWGRKAIGYATAALHLLSNVAPALCFNLEVLYVSRTLLGWATTLSFIFIPLYIREISDDRSRGPLGVLMTVIINVGVLGAYVIGSYCSVRVTSWLCAVPSAAFLVLFLWMPETPVFLVRTDREDEARQALRLLRGRHYDVDAEVDAVRDSLRAMKAEGGGGRSILKELVTSRASRRAGLIMLVIIINHQFSGFFCVVTYTVQIFQEAGNQMSPYISCIVIGSMLLLGAVISAFLCSHVGRKRLLIISNVLLILSLFGVGLYFYLQHIGLSVLTFSWVTVVCLSVYVVSFNIGLGPLWLVLCTEMFSPKLVSTVLALLGPLIGMFSFVIGKFFYRAADVIGVYSCYWGYASVCFFAMVFIIVVMPETKDRPIELIIKELEGERKQTEGEV